MYLASGPSGMKATENRNSTMLKVSPVSIPQFYHCKIAFLPVGEFDSLPVPEGWKPTNKMLYNFLALSYFCTWAKEQLETEQFLSVF